MLPKRTARPYMEVLRSAEPYPSFDEIGALVMRHERRRFVPLMTGAKYFAEMALLAAAMLAAVWFTAPSVKAPGQRLAASSNPIDAVGASTAVSATGSIRPTHTKATLRGSPVGQGTYGTKATEMTTNPPGGLVQIQEIPSNQLDGIEVSKTSARLLAEPATPRPVLRNQAIVATPILGSDDVVRQHPWMAFASGGYVLPEAASAIAGAPLALGGSVGLRWQWKDASAWVVEVRRNTFHRIQSVRVASLRDTTYSLDGHTLQNTIGSFSAATTSEANVIGSLDAGYRIELWPNDNLTPFGQILLGASVSGGLASASIGLCYALSTQFLFDLSARTDQLVSPTSSPQRAFGVEATVAFGW